MLDYVLAAKLLLAGAALICLCFMIKGLIDMQRINTTDPSVLETQGMVRQLTPRGGNMEAIITLNVDDEVVHVPCLLPGGCSGRKQWQVTDLVKVFWRKGDKRAVAAETIKAGQRTFLVSFMALTATALLYVLLF